MDGGYVHTFRGVILKKSCLLLLISVLYASLGFAADEQQCKKASQKFAEYVESARRIPAADRDAFMLDQMRGEDFKSNGSKLAGRANVLVDTSLTKREAQTSLYSYCMSM